MKKLTLILLLIASATIFSNGQSKYRTYTNDRYYFSVEYPSDMFTMQAPPANNDGRTFRSKDRKTEMRVWGGYNVLDKTLKAAFDEALDEIGAGVTYKFIGENSFVVSGIRGANIYYRKTLLNRAGTEVFYTFTIEYPRSQRSRFDSVVTRISRSFKFDPDAEI